MKHAPDELASELIAMTVLLAERFRRLGGSTLKLIGHIARNQRHAQRFQRALSRCHSPGAGPAAAPPPGARPCSTA